MDTCKTDLAESQKKSDQATRRVTGMGCKSSSWSRSILLSSHQSRAPWKRDPTYSEKLTKGTARHGCYQHMIFWSVISHLLNFCIWFWKVNCMLSLLFKFFCMSYSYKLFSFYRRLNLQSIILMSNSRWQLTWGFYLLFHCYLFHIFIETHASPWVYSNDLFSLSHNFDQSNNDLI